MRAVTTAMFSPDPNGAPGAASALDARDIRPARGRVALAFVLLTLAALVLVPVLAQRRVDQLRATIEAAEPARTLINRLQFNLVREMASLNEVLLSGDRTYVQAFADARAAEDQILAELAVILPALGPGVQGQFETVRALTRVWHERAADPSAAYRSESGSAELPGRERQLFEEVLRQAGALDSAVVVAVGAGRRSIEATERAGIRLTLLLGALAFAAAVVVASLNRRVRRFAAESERRRLQAERALAESARAQLARVRLLRGITHDVKNPLGAAQGYAELLAMEVKGPILPEQAPLVEGVQRSISAALAIVADLLDVAHADSGELPVRRVGADLREVVEPIVADHRGEAETAGHVLSCECPRGIEVYTDALRVRQVLGNLLSNAIKYTPAPGRIHVHCRTGVERAARSGRWASVAVSDNGPGIPPDQHDAVFDEFTRLGDGTGKKGHGLGLAIARRVAALLGGDLTLEDGAAPGATFVLWLPLRKEEEEAEEEGKA